MTISYFRISSYSIYQWHLLEITVCFQNCLNYWVMADKYIMFICKNMFLISLFSTVSPSSVMVSVSGGVTPISGTSSTLECSATAGNPSETTYRWTKGATEVQAASATSSLTFIPTASDNGQIYTCFASNTVDTDPSSSLSLVVYSESHRINIVYRR